MPVHPPRNLREHGVIWWRRLWRSPKTLKAMIVFLWVWTTAFVTFDAWARTWEAVPPMLAALAFGTYHFPRLLDRLLPASGRCPECEMPFIWHSKRQFSDCGERATREHMERMASIPHYQYACERCGDSRSVSTRLPIPDDAEAFCPCLRCGETVLLVRQEAP